jgi:hypothetical protein
MNNPNAFSRRWKSHLATFLRQSVGMATFGVLFPQRKRVREPAPQAYSVVQGVDISTHGLILASHDQSFAHRFQRASAPISTSGFTSGATHR